MSEDNGSVAELAPAPELPADAPSTFASVSEAARFLSKSRGPKEEPVSSAESAVQATAEPELAQANAGPDENPVPGEVPEGNDPEAEKLPSIERPRSWSKDDDDDWNSLP